MADEIFEDDWHTQVALRVQQARQDVLHRLESVREKTEERRHLLEDSRDMQNLFKVQ
jgi:hypothetical protein